MIIALWIILRILFFAAAIFLLYQYFKSLINDGSFHVMKHGLNKPFKNSQFDTKANHNQYTLELYKWSINEGENVCEEALDRAAWPAMDIADWMKEGLPRSSDGTSLCGRNCQCKLTRYKVKPTRQPKSL
ncbi:MAG: hypothetical protein KBD53_00985 [Candidatus Omnitrophica bacterium]|nr:hypothetical protein [Candidatus Omnitrophota bacterium]